MANPNSYCANKNCRLPNPQILNHLHKESKLTWKQLADIFKISERTLRRHARQSEKERQKVKQKRGNKDKITGGNLEFLLSLSDEGSGDNSLTQEEMAKELKEKDLLVSQQTISRVLKKKGHTSKRITYKPLEQRWSEIERFWDNNRHLPLTQFSALDEFSFHLNAIPRYAWAPRGKRAWVLKPTKKGTNITLIIFIQRTERKWIIHWEIFIEAVNTQVFDGFLTRLKPSTQNSLTLLDNVSFHHAHKKRKELGLPTVRERLKEKNMIATYLPPHTPMSNPTEYIGNTARHNLEKGRNWTVKKFLEALSKEMNRLNKEDLTPYFRHALTYFDEKIIKSRTEYWQRKAPLVFFNGVIIYGSVRVYRLC